MGIGLSFPSTNRLVDVAWRPAILGRSALARGRGIQSAKVVVVRGVILVVVPEQIVAAVVEHVITSLVVVVDPNEVALVVQTLVAVVVRVRTLDGQYFWVPLAQVVVPSAQMVVPLAKMLPQAHLPHLGSPH